MLQFVSLKTHVEILASNTIISGRSLRREEVINIPRSGICALIKGVEDVGLALFTM